MHVELSQKTNVVVDDNDVEESITNYEMARNYIKKTCNIVWVRHRQVTEYSAQIHGGTTDRVHMCVDMRGPP